MDSAKEMLRNTIELLNEEEVHQILEFAQRLMRERKSVSQTLQRLARDPTFHVPAEPYPVFHPIEPIQGKGIAASKLLVEDRR